MMSQTQAAANQSPEAMPAVADAILDWMVGITERGEYLKLLLKGTPHGHERDALLASTLRLHEKCWEELAEIEKSLPARTSFTRRKP